METDQANTREDSAPAVNQPSAAVCPPERAEGLTITSSSVRRAHLSRRGCRVPSIATARLAPDSVTTREETDSKGNSKSKGTLFTDTMINTQKTQDSS